MGAAQVHGERQVNTEQQERGSVDQVAAGRGGGPQTEAPHEQCVSHPPVTLHTHTRRCPSAFWSGKQWACDTSNPVLTYCTVCSGITRLDGGTYIVPAHRVRTEGAFRATKQVKLSERSELRYFRFGTLT